MYICACICARAQTHTHRAKKIPKQKRKRKEEINSLFCCFHSIWLIGSNASDSDNKNKTKTGQKINTLQIYKESKRRVFFLFFSKVYRMECFSVGPIMQPIAVIHICFSVLFLKKATARKSHKTQSQQPINIFILPVKNIFILPVKNNSRMDR